MGIEKPYYRIFREGPSLGQYILDKRYADDRYLLCRAYSILEQDLIKVFEYIEPTDDHKDVFSLRTYDLLLRACTEFESNCKRILLANEYSFPDKLKTKDYFKIEQATKLSKYEVRLNIWYPFGIKIIKPFIEWGDGPSLLWYQAYNKVKHDRSQMFSKASFWNVVNAVAGVFAILYAQFSYYVFDSYQELDSYSFTTSGTSCDDGFEYSPRSLFAIKPFNEWPPEDRYVFDWPLQGKDEIPFQKFDFN